jgi:hypothetical protein
MSNGTYSFLVVRNESDVHQNTITCTFLEGTVQDRKGTQAAVHALGENGVFAVLHVPFLLPNLL